MRFLRKIPVVIFWGFFLLMSPLAVAGFFFKPSFFLVAVFFFCFLRYLLPRLAAGVRVRSPRAALLWTEVLIVFLAMVHYTTDNRKGECAFDLDPRIKPLLTYNHCMEMDGENAEKCKSAIMDPYALAMYKGELLAACGRNGSTLVRLDPNRPGRFTAEDVGYGNVQQIVVIPEKGHAVMPRWKEKKRILVYDLERGRAVRYLETSVTKLVGAERYGDYVFVISEEPCLYRIDLKDYGIREYRLPYSHKNLYDIRGDERRRALFFTDWVFGLVYRFDEDLMEPDRQRFLGGVVTGTVLDSEKCELYVSNGIPGKVHVMDCETLKTLKSFRVGLGAHELALSRDGSKIYLVNYFRGKFEEIERSTGKILFEAEVGGQTRDLFYDKVKNRLFVCSKCGIYEVKID